MTQATITRVIDKPRPWGEKWPGSVSVTVKFADGSIGEVATKEQYAAGHIEALKALLDKPSEFELEARGEYDGIPQFKVKNYPGKPGSDKGGRREYVPRFIDTEEGAKYVQERMDRRTALMQALGGGWKDVGGITLVADQLYDWLRKNLDVSGSGTGAPAAPDSSRDELHRPDTSSDEGKDRAPAMSHPPSTEHSSDAALEGGAIGEPQQPPSRRTCLHTGGMHTVTGSDGRVRDVCDDCGKVLQI